MLLLITAAAYYYFNWQYFSMAGKLRQMQERRVWFVLLSFGLNYLFCLQRVRIPISCKLVAVRFSFVF